MDDNQRKRILDNIDSLINLTDFDELCNACFEHQLLSTTMIENIRRMEPQYLNGEWHHDHEDAIKREHHKQLFIKITKRGPKAFEKLRRILVALKYKDALKILFDGSEDISIKSSLKMGFPIADNSDDDYSEDNNEDINNNNDGGELSNNSNNATLHEYQETLIQPQKNIQVRKATNLIIDPKIGSYQMESKDKRGIFFMIRSDRQKQLDENDHLLITLFKLLDFKIYAYCNITYDTFTQLLEDLLKSNQIKGIESFFLVIRTGGVIVNGVQRMIFNDGAIVTIKDIQKYFNHNRCPELFRRPKIFIFPYNETPRTTETEGAGQGGFVITIPQLSDVINCYVTNKGFMDHRDDDNFPCYIQNFVDVIAEKAYKTHFENMLKEIHNKVQIMSTAQGRVQVSKFDNICFNKTLYLNPGIYN